MRSLVSKIVVDGVVKVDHVGQVDDKDDIVFLRKEGNAPIEFSNNLDVYIGTFNLISRRAEINYNNDGCNDTTYKNTISIRGGS
jgi:hypothetical protein